MLSELKEVIELIRKTIFYKHLKYLFMLLKTVHSKRKQILKVVYIKIDLYKKSFLLKNTHIIYKYQFLWKTPLKHLQKISDKLNIITQ